MLATFWNTLFAPWQSAGRLLDVACGNGAVTGYANGVAPRLRLCAADYSVSAGVELRKRYPATGCVAADARRLPFADAQFDLVCSQFGIEYAGVGAFAEAARLLRPGGVLAAVAHLHDGAIFRECRANEDAAAAVLASNVLPQARLAFAAGYALNSGHGDVASFKAAERQFTPTVRALEQVIAQHGRESAGGLAQQIYRDIAHMYRRMSAFEAAEVLGWIDGMLFELQAYCGRMRSMQHAALDASAQRQIGADVAALGLTLSEQRIMTMGSSNAAAAVVLVWSRP